MKVRHYRVLLPAYSLKLKMMTTKAKLASQSRMEESRHAPLPKAARHARQLRMRPISEAPRIALRPDSNCQSRQRFLSFMLNGILYQATPARSHEAAGTEIRNWLTKRV